jgi:predicted RNA-binding Zn-ribbon protein involved in translation (DUF1610 family)
MPAGTPPPDTCAQCGAVIPPQARACPECGADERTGWRESSAYDGLDLPDCAFGDDDGAGSSRSRWRHPLKWYWLAAGLLVLILLVWGAFAR